jgi:hypothetical protein
MQALERLETKLDELLRKKAPVQLSDSSRKVIVEYLPWINLLLGLLVLYTAWALYHWAHIARDALNYLNSLSQSLGGTGTTAPRLTVVVWLGIIALVIEGALCVAAFPGARDRKKQGWNLLFYAALVNVVYGVVISFSSYLGVGRLVWSLLTSIVGLYFLFQIRGYYTGRRAVSKEATKA